MSCDKESGGQQQQQQQTLTEMAPTHDADIHKLWYVRGDWCGRISAALTVLLILYAQLTVMLMMWQWQGVGVHMIAYSTITALAIYSHCRAQFQDPGSIPHRAPDIVYVNATVKTKSTQSVIAAASSDDSVQPSSDDNTAETQQQQQQQLPVKRVAMAPRSCKRCHSIKPSKAHHCSTCGRCITRMDHHCPWVNNCVALFNQKYFLLFLFYTLLLCCYSGSLCVLRFIDCSNNIRRCTATTTTVALMIGLFIEAVVFGLFVIIMGFDQVTAIFENTTGIDALKKITPSARTTRYQALVLVFGESLSYRWLLPLPLSQQLLLLYQRDCNDFSYDQVRVLASSVSGNHMQALSGSSNSNSSSSNNSSNSNNSNADSLTHRHDGNTNRAPAPPLPTTAPPAHYNKNSSSSNSNDTSNSSSNDISSHDDDCDDHDAPAAPSKMRRMFEAHLAQ